MIIQEMKLYEWSDSVYLKAYIPDPVKQWHADGARPAVIICPGGGYMGHNEHEMEPVALKFLAEGYCAFVLNHSVGAGHALMPGPLLEVAASIEKIREFSACWHIDPERICLCGFSTGGHLVALYGAMWHELNVPKPYAVVLGYPVLELTLFKEQIQNAHAEMMPSVEMLLLNILGEMEPSIVKMEAWSCSNHVTPHASPAFIWSMRDDVMVPPTDHHDYISQLQKCSVPYEHHVFSQGSHGAALARHLTGTKAWLGMAISWLEGLSAD